MRPPAFFVRANVARGRSNTLEAAGAQLVVQHCDKQDRKPKNMKASVHPNNGGWERLRPTNQTGGSPQLTAAPLAQALFSCSFL